MQQRCVCGISVAPVPHAWCSAGRIVARSATHASSSSGRFTAAGCAHGCCVLLFIPLMSRLRRAPLLVSRCCAHERRVAWGLPVFVVSGKPALFGPLSSHCHALSFTPHVTWLPDHASCFHVCLAHRYLAAVLEPGLLLISACGAVGLSMRNKRAEEVWVGGIPSGCQLDVARNC